MIKVVLTHAVEDVERWLSFKGERAASIGAMGASNVVDHVAALDRQLNEKGYILPGLGDAGDRQFGTGKAD